MVSSSKNDGLKIGNFYCIWGILFSTVIVLEDFFLKKKKDKFYYPYLTDHSYSELSYLAFYSRPKPYYQENVPDEDNVNCIGSFP